MNDTGTTDRPTVQCRLRYIRPGERVMQEATSETSDVQTLVNDLRAKGYYVAGVEVLDAKANTLQHLAVAPDGSCTPTAPPVTKGTIALGVVLGLFIWTVICLVLAMVFGPLQAF